jgi:hypothetical protein
MKPTIASLVLLLLAGPARAQEGTGAEGTPPQSRELSLDLRFFEAGEGYVALGWQQQWSPRIHNRLNLLWFESRADNPGIAGDTWETAVSLGEIGSRRRVCRSGSQELWLDLGGEWHSSKGTNATIGEWAQTRRPIPTLGLLAEGNLRGERLKYRVGPRMALFESSVVATTGERLRSFGKVVGLEVGLQARVNPSWEVYGTAIPILSGDNTIDPDTGRVDQDIVWSAGVKYRPRESSRWRLELYATNSAGPTAATSLIAAVDQSAAPGLRVHYEF